MEQIQKALSDDTVFNTVNKNFISLQDAELKRNNFYLNKAITSLIELMKSSDPLFAKAYKEIIFTGSFYKGTKVGKPNEFDLNIVLKLPINYKHIELRSTQPGFTKIFVGNPLCMYAYSPNILSEKQNRILYSLTYNDYLDPNQFRYWMEGVISKAIRKLPKYKNGHILEAEEEYFNTLNTVKKSGPAFTVTFNIPQTDEPIDVDLAPVLSFNKYIIYGTTLQLDEVQKYRNKTWFAVPVPSANPDFYEIRNLHWRFSFCHQEREMLAQHGRIKPVIRQMKKLRDVQNWKSIASYFIETLFLNKLKELQDDLDRMPLTYFFYKMLRELHYACKQHKIEYFWDKQYNLLGKIGTIEMMNIAYRLNSIIKDIEKNAMSDRFIVSTYILTGNELQQLKKVYDNVCVGEGEMIYDSNVINATEENNNDWKCAIL